jgi:hypothetical protein
MAMFHDKNRLLTSIFSLMFCFLPGCYTYGEKNMKATINYSLSYSSLQTYHDFAKAEIYVLLKDQKHQKAITLQYYERDPEESLINFLKDVLWDVPISPGCSLLASTSGIRVDYLNIYWFAWYEGNQLSTYSMYLQKPIIVNLQANDIIISSPVVTADKKLNVFVLRSGQLWHYSFSGMSDTEASVQAKKIAEFQGHPTMGASVPIPQSDKNEIVLCWVSSTIEGLQIYNAIFKNNELKVVKSDLLKDMQPIKRCKGDIHVSEAGPITFGFVGKDPQSYLMVTSSCDFDASTCTVNSEEIDISLDELSASATFFLKHPQSCRYYTYLLTNEKSLYKYRDDMLQEIREDVDLTYDFPIVTTITFFYEAQMNENGEIELKSI